MVTVTDNALADEGERRIVWASRHSPVMHSLVTDRLADGALSGRRLAVVVHLEAKTAHLAALLAESGADVVVAGSNPATTDDAVCAALRRRGLPVHGRHGADPAEFERDLLAAADFGPELIIDDGAELTSRIERHRPELFDALSGVSEQTTTGVARLRALAERHPLPFGAIAANDARCKHLFDNRYGTGQTALSAVLRLTNLLASGRRWCIVGYGWVGKGLARYAEGAGGRVTVVETDPVAALEAHMDGHDVAPLASALPRADVVITATGGAGAVRAEHLPLVKDGALLANAGHDDQEIDVAGLQRLAESVQPAREGVTRYVLPGGRRVHLLVGGSLVNIAGARGHPIEIMDLSFAVQATAIHHLASGAMPPGLHAFPAELDAAIARTKLTSLGIDIEPSTAAAHVRAAVSEAGAGEVRRDGVAGPGRGGSSEQSGTVSEAGAGEAGATGDGS